MQILADWATKYQHLKTMNQGYLSLSTSSRAKEKTIFCKIAFLNVLLGQRNLRLHLDCIREKCWVAMLESETSNVMECKHWANECLGKLRRVRQAVSKQDKRMSELWGIEMFPRANQPKHPKKYLCIISWVYGYRRPYSFSFCCYWIGCF